MDDIITLIASALILYDLSGKLVFIFDAKNQLLSYMKNNDLALLSPRPDIKCDKYIQQVKNIIYKGENPSFLSGRNYSPFIDKRIALAIILYFANCLGQNDKCYRLVRKYKKSVLYKRYRKDPYISSVIHGINLLYKNYKRKYKSKQGELQQFVLTRDAYPLLYNKLAIARPDLGLKQIPIPVFMETNIPLVEKIRLIFA